MSDPLVTIVTPSFNQGGFIRDTIESVLSQDYPRIEYIVMDGGSTDGTAAIAAEYAGRLTWISEKDRGQTHAINKGFQRARGEIVAWLNSDDVLLPGAVRAAVEGFRQRPDVGAVYGEGYLIDREGSIKMRFPATEPFNLWCLYWLSDYVLQQSAFFRRPALEELGWLDESLHWTMDWDIFVRLGTRYGLHYIPAYMGCIREYAETKTGSGGGKRFREIWRLLHRQTGSVWAPACWSYGLDTYDKIWRGMIRRCGVGPLRHIAWPLADFVFKLCRYKIDQVRRHAQGFYGGQWAARRLRWMLPGNTARVCVHGEVVEQRPQRLRLYSEGQLLAEQTFPPGEFKWDVDVSSVPRNGALNLMFLAGWDVEATPLPHDPCRLRVSWKVISIESAG